MTTADLQRLDFLQSINCRDVRLSGWEREFWPASANPRGHRYGSPRAAALATDRLLEKYDSMVGTADAVSPSPIEMADRL